MASSGYTLWSVVAGEQPTTAKWNILGNNDASFNSGVGFEDSTITNRHIALNAIFNSTVTSATENTMTTGSWVDAAGVSATVTTTKTNQSVVVFSQVQTYVGGYTSFRYMLDGVAVGNTGKYQTGVNSTTTGLVMFMDIFTIATTGSHVIKLQANGGANTLRIINGEGLGRIVVFLG